MKIALPGRENAVIMIKNVGDVTQGMYTFIVDLSTD